MKKRLTTLALACVMLIGSATTAFADGKFGQQGEYIRAVPVTEEERAAEEAEAAAYMARFDSIVPLSETGWKLDEKYRTGDGIRQYPGYVSEFGRHGVVFKYAGKEYLLSDWLGLETTLWATEWAEANKGMVTGSTEMEKALSASEIVRESFPYDVDYPIQLNSIYGFRDKKNSARSFAYEWLCRAVGLDTTNCIMWSTESNSMRGLTAVKIDGRWYWSDPNWYDVGDYADRALSRTLWTGSFDTNYNLYTNQDGTPNAERMDNNIPSYYNDGVFLKEDGGFN